MKYCPHCGVILERNEELCPLCGLQTQEEKPSSADAGLADYPPLNGDTTPVEAKVASSGITGIERLSLIEKRIVAIELASVGAFIAITVTVLLNLFTTKKLSWSLYSSAAALFLWSSIVLPLLLRNHLKTLFVAYIFSVSAIVFTLDILDGGPTWFFSYAAPIIADLTVTVLISTLFIRLTERKGLNILAIALCSVIVFMLALEFIIDINSSRGISLTWSVVTSLVLATMALALFYLHYRIVHKASLRKLFRL